ncbi:MAG: hypothetical protein JW751_28485 [Polyangiaceae bacterium]|nr:hypothetical protein [Polyangiaceae bacterium]
MNHPTRRKERIASPEEWAREAKALDEALFARRGYCGFRSIGLDVIGLDDGTDLLRPGTALARPATPPKPAPAATVARPRASTATPPAPIGVGVGVAKPKPPTPPPPAPPGTATAAWLAGKAATAKSLDEYLEEKTKEPTK